MYGHNNYICSKWSQLLYLGTILVNNCITLVRLLYATYFISNTMPTNNTNNSCT